MEVKGTVIMADDDQDDCFLAQEAFVEISVPVDFSCLEDGLVLMDYLSEQSRPEVKALPTLILLDLNMPRKDGRQTLQEIKAEPRLREIPIVIFTTSDEEKDKCFAAKAGADLFIIKPSNYDEWVKIMKSLAERWLI
jgi:DNA-binding response OmpR family regulator